MLFRILLILAALASASVRADELVLEDAWARATPAGAYNAAVYGRIVNESDRPIVITEVSSGAAGVAMLHRTVERDGMMRMVHQDRLPVAPGEEIDLAPGALHIMLMRLRGPLVAGERLELTLLLADGRHVSAEVRVAPVGSLGWQDG